MSKKTKVSKSFQVRHFCGKEILQRKSDEFLDGTALMRIYNESITGLPNIHGIVEKQKEMDTFFKGAETAQTMIEFAIRIGNYNPADGSGLNIDYNSRTDVKKLAKDLGLLSTKQGRGGVSWMHPYLFVMLAEWLSPSIRANVIMWVTDNLILNREITAKMYKPMIDALVASVPELNQSSDLRKDIPKYVMAMNAHLFDIHKTGIRECLDSNQLEDLIRAEKLIIRLAQKGKIRSFDDFIDSLDLLEPSTALSEEQRQSLGIMITSQ